MEDEKKPAGGPEGAGEVSPAKGAKRGAGRFVNLPKGRGPWALFAVMAALVVASLVPTRTGPLVDEYPSFQEQSHRRPLPAGTCSLRDARLRGAACEPFTVAGVREEEVSFPSSLPDRGLPALRGTLSVPDGAPGPRPAVILIGGSGRHTRNGENPGDLVSHFSPPFEVLRALADLFAREGLVVLRYDKRGPTNYPEIASDAAMRKFQFTDFMQDAEDGLAFLATRPEVDPRALLVAGHSEGGGFAVHIGTRRPDLAGVIALAAIYDVQEPSAQLRATAEIRLRQLDVVTYAMLHVQVRKWTGCVEKARAGGNLEENCVDGHTPQRLLREQVLFSEQTFQKAKELRVPFLALQGSVDRNIDPTSLPRLREALSGVPESDFELHYLRGLNHPLVDVTAMPHPAAFGAGLREALHGFLTRTPWPGPRP